MTKSKKPLHLFAAYGIELEYMIVDVKTLKVLPIADELLNLAAQTKAGEEQVSDFENGRITWSNELVLHVIEIKTSGPDPKVESVAVDFQKNIEMINGLLKTKGAMLMPGGMHPTMDPGTEKKLWPHDNNEIYAAYDRIFNCQGHGWSNLQSMHINLPFANDEEFAKLHTAIRFLLPILPALSASSPIADGKLSGESDTRLLAYQQNQKRIPSITGKVIPEPVRSIADYHEMIFKKIFADIAPHDTENQLQEEWLNSRGAIARFDRNAIEIRILDTQECPNADLAIAELVIAILKNLVSETSVDFETQIFQDTAALKQIFDQTAHAAEAAIITDRKYLAALGIKDAQITAQNLWKHLFETFQIKKTVSKSSFDVLSTILHDGSLSTRLKKDLGKAPSRTAIDKTFRKLSECLDAGKLFESEKSI